MRIRIRNTGTYGTVPTYLVTYLSIVRTVPQKQIINCRNVAFFIFEETRKNQAVQRCLVGAKFCQGAVGYSYRYLRFRYLKEGSPQQEADGGDGWTQFPCTENPLKKNNKK